MIDKEANDRFINTPAMPYAYECGIYVILNTKTHRVYVGSSYQVGRRWRNHVYKLRKGKHTARDLQSDWNTYGHEAFQFRLVERIDRYNPNVRPLDRERVYLRAYKDRLYNYDRTRVLKVEPGALLARVEEPQQVTQ